MSVALHGETARRYRLILDLARDVTAQLDLENVLARTFHGLRQLLSFSGGSIALVDDDGEYLAFAATDPPATAEALAMRIPVGEGVAGGIAASGEPAYLPDILADPSVTPERRKRAVSTGVRSYFGVPLITEGRAIGVLQIDSTEVDAFPEEDRLLVMSFTPIVAAAVQNSRLYALKAAALERVRELEQRQRDFVAVVSHELRTPLTAVIGFADTIVDHAKEMSLDDVLLLVGRARGAAVRLADLVEELLDLSVLERGELRLSPEVVDVRGLIDEVVTDYAGGREVRTEVADDVTTVVADRRRLSQVVGNLLGNAVKFAGAAPVTVTARTDGDELVLSVRDQGPGIAPADQARIFERFMQLERADVRRVGGFGVGLYVVRRFCDAMGAQVAVRSEPGRGAEFTVRLPARAALTLP